MVDNVSEGGARLTVGDSIKGLQLTEFFLVLSSRGLAYRRCQLVWVNGDQIGVSFINYLAELPYFRDEVLARLIRLGVRQAG